MPTRDSDDRTNLLQGTLDLLILRTLVLGPQHGQGIARSIQRQSDEVFLVDHGSLYLALQRLEERGWIDAQWGVSENNRRVEAHRGRHGTRSRRGRIGGLRMFWRKQRSFEDFRAEIESHLALEAVEIHETRARVDADAAARRSFGNITALQERWYEHGRWMFFDHLGRELRQGV